MASKTSALTSLRYRGAQRRRADCRPDGHYAADRSADEDVFADQKETIK